MSDVVLDSDFAFVFYFYLMSIVGGAWGLRFSLPTTTSVILLHMTNKNFEPWSWTLQSDQVSALFRLLCPTNTNKPPKAETNWESLLFAVWGTSQPRAHLIIMSNKPDSREIQMVAWPGAGRRKRKNTKLQAKGPLLISFLRPGEKVGKEAGDTGILAMANYWKIGAAFRLGLKKEFDQLLAI